MKFGKGRLPGLRPPRVQELRPAGRHHQEDRRRGVRGHRQEPAARHRPRARRGGAVRRLLHLAASSTRTSTSTRGSSTRRWASRSRCSRCSSPSRAPPGGWRTGWSCSSRTRRSPGLGSSTRAPRSATTSPIGQTGSRRPVHAVTIVDGALEWREHPDPEPGVGRDRGGGAGGGHQQRRPPPARRLLPAAAGCAGRHPRARGRR